ncbi:hypothetical protein [Streptomyces sp. NBC_00582]|uniref:hypothetical protein n=1 Tax=Streptomyces sp. NBC_00582 TaxID=2975783 RepID=UPI002E7FBF1F|nr:hypothetical protein [Streptomyces sp. NBC_00582]WUB61506.1 hypothetical protein OG852_14455 [Streptomyces sp. NBC_00582]
MTFEAAPQPAPWFELLEGSVRALGEAAREWQIADRAAALNVAHLERSNRFHEGKTTHEPGPGTPVLWRRTRTNHRPHVQAFFTLQRVYGEHRRLTRREYRQAALLFASGAAWAIGLVQDGQEPRQVVFELDGYERPAPVPHPCAIAGLTGWVHGGEVERAYERLTSKQLAFDVCEEIAGRDDRDVTERDANEMFDAADAARGLEDAAYEYGLLAERALGHVLLPARDTHRRQLAEQRAAGAAQSGEVAQ